MNEKNNADPTGVQHEVEFWKGFVKSDRFLKGWVPQVKTPELNDIVADFIKEHIPMHGSILDCGSGVVSILNGLLPGNYQLVATDLLGDHYGEFFPYKDHGLVQPLAIGAENLDFPNQFDIVHMSNALDHTQDPVKAYEKLLSCVKPGGYLIIQGFEDEAIHENWKGMHQWNLKLIFEWTNSWDQFGNYSDDWAGIKASEGVFIIEGRSGNKYFFHTPIFAKNVKFENNKTWYIWIVQK